MSRRRVSFFPRVERFTILRRRLKMKLVDRRNRFLDEEGIYIYIYIFFSAANAHATFSVFPRDIKNSPQWNWRGLSDGYLIFPKTRVSIRNPVASLRFFTREPAVFSPFLFPSYTSIWIGRLSRPVPVASPMTLIAHKLIDKSFRVFDRQSLILSMFALKR